MTQGQVPSFQLMSSIFSYLNGWGRIPFIFPAKKAAMVLELRYHTWFATIQLIHEHQSQFEGMPMAPDFYSRLEMAYACFEWLWFNTSDMSTAHDSRRNFWHKIRGIFILVAKGLRNNQMLEGIIDSLSEPELMILAREARAWRLGMRNNFSDSVASAEKFAAVVRPYLMEARSTTHARLAVLIGSRREMYVGIQRMLTEERSIPWLQITKTLVNLIWPH